MDDHSLKLRALILSSQKPSQETSKRKKLAEQNRQTLIDATLDSIAEIGIAGTSVSEIIRRANLSRGMIHLHFGSKDNLLVAAVMRAGEDYYEHLEIFLANAANPAQDRLAAIIDCDLDERVLNKRSVNIWYAFRGEAREGKAISKYTDTRDARLNTLIYQTFRGLTDIKNSDEAAVVARDATLGTLALLEGMWTDFLLHSDVFERERAKRIIFRFLAALYPMHFDIDGAK
ncbi:MAG: TetR family transcriptional regulator [Gammaproteobacteria bacterium]|nr:TetR family transcriptional regulator [Gammaproteobacteria bacterium]